ncbi:MAG: PIN domain-containing protein [Halobacteriota archaeon]|nr:PIN domain-containing protein [Halobacteriota archaeon]
MTVLVDSSAWIEYFKGTDPGIYAKKVLEESSEKVIVSLINIGEVYSWVLRYYSIDIAEEMRKTMETRAFVSDITEPIIVEAAMMKNANGWELDSSIIFVTARKEGASILTGDPNFKDLKESLFIF